MQLEFSNLIASSLLSILLSKQDGVNIVLLPYTHALVPIYHAWMQDPTLLELTASEPLTLEQEYANQVSWNEDPTKYCFIIHSRRPVIRTFQSERGVQTPYGVDYTLASQEEADAMRKPVDVEWTEEKEEEEEQISDEEENENGDSKKKEQKRTVSASPRPRAIADASTNSSTAATAVSASSANPPTEAITSSPASTANTAASATESSSDITLSSFLLSSSIPSSLSVSTYPLTPIGDVNLFLYPDFNLEDYGISGGGCEIEVMIAEKSYLRRGLGEEAVRLIMKYSADVLGVERFVVKISSENKASVGLFEKKLGFRVVEYVECFDEVVLFKDTSLNEPAAVTDGIDAQSQQQQQEEASSTINTLTSQVSRLHTNETMVGTERDEDEESKTESTTSTTAASRG